MTEPSHIDRLIACRRTYLAGMIEIMEETTPNAHRERTIEGYRNDLVLLELVALLLSGKAEDDGDINTVLLHMAPTVRPC